MEGSVAEIALADTHIQRYVQVHTHTHMLYACMQRNEGSESTHACAHILFVFAVWLTVSWPQLLVIGQPVRLIDLLTTDQPALTLVSCVQRH